MNAPASSGPSTAPKLNTVLKTAFAAGIRFAGTSRATDALRAGSDGQVYAAGRLPRSAVDCRASAG